MMTAAATAPTEKPDLSSAHNETKDMLLSLSSQRANSLWTRYLDCSVATKLNIYHGVNSLIGLGCLCNCSR